MKKIICILAVLLSLAVLFSSAFPAFGAPLLGDADGDERLTPGDARLVLRFSIGLEAISPRTLPYCDVDFDGHITPADARLVLRYSIGLFTEDGETKPSTPEQTTKAEPLTEPTTKEPTTTPAPAKSAKTQYIENLSNAVSTAEILDNFTIFTDKVGSRWYSSEGLEKGRGWVSGILKYYGFAESEITFDGFDCKGETVYNVYTKITTAVKNPDIILFVAHYDSYHTGAGAVDNASGLCTVLEIARVFKALNMDFGVELRFLFTAGEELGYYGAYRYVNSFSPASLDRHVAVFNVDMSAHFNTNKNHYLTVSTKSAYGSNAKSNMPSLAVDEAKKVVGSCGEYKYMSPVAAGLHDLIPFDGKGVPTITLSWREINYDNSYGSQDGLAAPAEIHSSYDVAKNVNMDSLYKTTRLAVASAAAMVYDYQR